MGTFYLGPLEAPDIETIKRALEVKQAAIENIIENSPVLTEGEAAGIAAEQARVGRLIEVCESLILKN